MDFSMGWTSLDIFLITLCIFSRFVHESIRQMIRQMAHEICKSIVAPEMVWKMPSFEVIWLLISVRAVAKEKNSSSDALQDLMRTGCKRSH
jgi:aminoglycoside N3'-acetyltransferase